MVRMQGLRTSEDCRLSLQNPALDLGMFTYLTLERSTLITSTATQLTTAGQTFGLLRISRTHRTDRGGVTATCTEREELSTGT